MYYMSFYAITVTFKTHDKERSDIVHNARYGDNLLKIIDGINQYRDPDNTIDKLFTMYGKPVNKQYWNLKLTESVSFYID